MTLRFNFFSISLRILVSIFGMLLFLNGFVLIRSHQVSGCSLIASKPYQCVQASGAM
jgi:hypothetical protein